MLLLLYYVHRTKPCMVIMMYVLNYNYETLTFLLTIVSTIIVLNDTQVNFLKVHNCVNNL